MQRAIAATVWLIHSPAAAVSSPPPFPFFSLSNNLSASRRSDRGSLFHAQIRKKGAESDSWSMAGGPANPESLKQVAAQKREKRAQTAVSAAAGFLTQPPFSSFPRRPLSAHIQSSVRPIHSPILNSSFKGEPAIPTSSGHCRHLTHPDHRLIQ